MAESENTIRLRARLSAYTKGAIPTKLSQLENDSDYVVDVPYEGDSVYVRRKGDWVQLDQSNILTDIEPLEDSGIIINKVNGVVHIGLDRWTGRASELPYVLNSTTTYYTYKEDSFEEGANGGTAYSDDPIYGSSYETIYFGGDSSADYYDIEFMPLSSKGE